MQIARTVGALVTLAAMPRPPPSRNAERVRLDALRYATGEEPATYVAIMRTFTVEFPGLLVDQSASEVTRRLTELGFELDRSAADPL